MALCVTCSFPPAWAATFVAARTARVPHGPKAACIHGRLACASGRLCRMKAPLREPFLPRPPEDARAALPTLAPACVLRGKRRARTPCRMTMRRRVVISALDAREPRSARQWARLLRNLRQTSKAAALAPPAIRETFSTTLQQNKRPERPTFILTISSTKGIVMC